MNKSEQLIACLEGEIAKRDARIVELESAAESLRLSRDYHHEQEIEYRRRWAGLNAAPIQQVSVPDAGLVEALAELVSAASSVNKGRAHEVRGLQDSEPCYWQRKEWIDWLVTLGEQGRAALAAHRPAGVV